MSTLSHLAKGILAILLGSIIQIGPAWAQEQDIRVNSMIDTTRMLIGDQVNVMLEVEQPVKTLLQFPVFQDTLVDKIEVLSVSAIDTISTTNNRLLLTQRLLVTSFDTGFYVIPSFYFIDRDTRDSIRTEALPLEVLTLEIDTTKGITDIKLPFDVPLTFMEILPYLVVGILLLGLIILIIYLRKKRKTKPEVKPVSIKPQEPAHLWALRNLDDLAKQKLWQKGKIKLYYSRLTEIIWLYLEYRFEIQAREQTTAEIIDACGSATELKIDLIENLRNILELADLVKFAKWQPVPEENEGVMEQTYDFVLKTKQTINLRVDDTKEDGGENG